MYCVSSLHRRISAAASGRSRGITIDDTISYDNTNGRIILGLCKNKLKSFSIKSVIYDNYIINYENAEERQFIDSFEIYVDIYDLLVWIDFKDFTTKGKVYKSNYF